MYLEHFGLTSRPFGISPRLDFLYKSSAFEESVAHLIYGLNNSEAIVMITGAIGTGKTMAIQSFLSHLGERYVSALITNTSVDSKELLKLILDDLGSPVAAGADKSDLLIAFKSFVMAASRQGQRVVVVIDEAQNLDREVLEEIRQLTNLGQGQDQPVQIILVGQPELEMSMERPDLAQLKQRIRVHYKLAPLSRQELQEYVDHRMTVAGGAAKVFSSSALDRIFELSVGVPRVINTLCNDALLSAYVAGRHRVEAKDLDEQGEPDSAPESKPAAEVPRKEMVVRRESRINTVGPAAPATPHVDSPMVRGRSGRVMGLLLATVIGAALVAALVATGQLKPLWSRLPFAGASGPVNDGQEAAADIQPVANETMSVVVGAAAVVDSIKPTLADSGAAMPLISGVETVPVATPEARSAVAATPEPDREAMEPATSVVEGNAGLAAAIEGEYFIHVSSFRTVDQAGAAARQFTDSGLIAVVHQQMVRDSLWFRVYLGPYASHEEAVRLANRLRGEGSISYYKVTRLDAEDGS
jgi:type II secretory pathway predicted ATPase ExeA/cell division protein FtsN